MSKNILKAIILLVVMMNCTGCIYFRLLEVKGQLKDFEKNFTMKAENGFTLIFKKPVIEKDDIVFLSTEKPESIVMEGKDEVCRYVMKKQINEQGIKSKNDEMMVYFTFDEQKKLKKIVYYADFPRIVKRQFLAGSFQELGYATLNEKGFNVSINLADKVKMDRGIFMSDDDFKQMFGEPSKLLRNKNNTFQQIYKYDFYGEKKTRIVFTQDLIFSDEDKKVSKITMGVKGVRILF